METKTPTTQRRKGGDEGESSATDSRSCGQQTPAATVSDASETSERLKYTNNFYYFDQEEDTDDTTDAEGIPVKFPITTVVQQGPSPRTKSTEMAIVISDDDEDSAAFATPRPHPTPTPSLTPRPTPPAPPTPLKTPPPLLTPSLTPPLFLSPLPRSAPSSSSRDWQVVQPKKRKATPSATPPSSERPGKRTANQGSANRNEQSPRELEIQRLQPNKRHSLEEGRKQEIRRTPQEKKKTPCRRGSSEAEPEDSANSEEENLANQPNTALGSMILETLQDITKVRVTSKNLKGTHCKVLKDAVRRIEDAVSEFVLRTPTHKRGETERGRGILLEEENRRLRNRVSLLERKIEALGVRITPQTPQTRQTEMRQRVQPRKEKDATPQEEQRSAREMERVISSIIDRKLTAFKEEMKTLIVGRRKMGREIPVPTTTAGNSSSESGTEPTQKLSWAEVAARKPTTATTTTKMGKQRVALPPTPKTRAKANTAGPNQGERPRETRTRETPIPRPRPRIRRRKAAVTITPTETAKMPLKEAIKKAKEEINLEEIGINGIALKKTLSGAVVIEVTGPNGEEKAEKLSKKIEEVIGGDGFKTRRPHRLTDFIVRDINDMTDRDEVRAALAKYGECPIEEIVLPEEIRRNARGIGSTWAKCPEYSAAKIAKNQKIRVGWSVVRIEMPEKRPQQCYKCWEYGHLAVNCKSEGVDRSNWCYVCGSPEHTTKDCRDRTPHCVLCEARGHPANHRMSGRQCKAAKDHKERSKGRNIPPKKSQQAEQTQQHQQQHQQQQSSSPRREKKEEGTSRV